MAKRPCDSRSDRPQTGPPRRWLVVVGLALLLAIVAVPSYGYYRTYVQPVDQVFGDALRDGLDPRMRGSKSRPVQQSEEHA